MGLILLIILILLLVGAFPAWPHARGWGYGPRVKGRRGVKRHIRMRGINGEVEGLLWENDTILRAGRLASLEIVLDDSSVSRRHAEIKHTTVGWRVRDTGSTNGTFLNCARLGAGEHPLHAHDIVRCGNVTMVVEVLRDGTPTEVPATPENMQVEAYASGTFEEALKGLVQESDNASPRPGQQLEVLLRAGHHLGHMESEEELLHAILNDAVSTLDAQRGAIVLADGPGGTLRLRALATGQGQMIDVSMLDSSLAVMGWVVSNYLNCGVVPQPMGNENFTASPSATFRTADRPLNIAANEDAQYRSLCDLIGRPELKTDPRFADRQTRKNNRDAMNAEIEPELMRRSAEEWETVMVAAGIPAFGVLRSPSPASAMGHSYRCIRRLRRIRSEIV